MRNEASTYHTFHPDHLGSTSYVTGADGTVAQHVEYIPYGEVFVEERSGTVGTAYLFNAKELDEETGMYYYGARYLDPTAAMWISVDPMWEKFAGMSAYNYCGGNPIKLVDPDGRDAKVTGNGSKDDPYVITAVYYYDNRIDESTVKELNSAISKYNNKGNAWKCAVNKEKTYVKFELSSKKVNEADITLRNNKEYLTDEIFSFGNMIDTEANEGKVGSADFKSVSINTGYIDKEVNDEGYNRRSLIEATFIHEIGHNLGLEHEDGSEIMRGYHVEKGKTDGAGHPLPPIYSYPKVTKDGVSAIIRKMHSNFKNVDAVRENGHYNTLNNNGIIVKSLKPAQP